MRLEATNKNVRGGLNKPPPLTGRVKKDENWTLIQKISIFYI